MRMTVRASVFETNSSATHYFIYASKETFEAWKRGEKMLEMYGFFDREYYEHDFVDARKCRKKKAADAPEWEYGTYEGVMKFLSELVGAGIFKGEANSKYVRPEELERDGDFVYQRHYLEVEDDGKNVTVRAWGMH
ncbi:MAG: hypothetical protein FWH44_05225 [Methanomassiliicoccaceae archaeon]|nr:hypothetical protein [Methanomassiliicoccaceae archaeon]